MKHQVEKLARVFLLKDHLLRKIKLIASQGMDLQRDYVALTPSGRAYKVISATNAWDSCINQHVHHCLV